MVYLMNTRTLFIAYSDVRSALNFKTIRDPRSRPKRFMQHFTISFLKQQISNPAMS